MIIQDSKLLQGLVHYLSFSAEAVRVDDAVEYFVDTETLLKGTAVDITYGEDVLGRADSVSIFNKTTSKITYSSIPNDLAGDISICVRFKADSLGESSQGIILASESLFLQLDDTTVQRSVKVSRNGSDWAYTGELDIPLAEEVALVITSDSSGVTNLYVSSERNAFKQTGEVDQNAGVPVASTYLVIGNNAAGSATFEGYIKDLLIWDWILDTKTANLACDILIS